MNRELCEASLLGAKVQVESAAPEVFGLLESELGLFFGLDRTPSAPACGPTTTLARVTFDVEEVEPPPGSGTPILLHSGSHSYDLRRGWLWDDGTIRIISSVDTGSLIRMDLAARTAHVTNASAGRGAEDVRRLVRDMLFLPWLESLGGIVVHGAAVVDASGRAVLILGDRGAGKTTLFMAAASAKGVSALSCERVVVLPTPDGLRVFACPEKISIFPGTLRSFEATRGLAGDVSSREWEREAKVRVTWPDLFKALRIHAANGALLSRVLFPRWSADKSDVTTLSCEEAYFRAEEHVVTSRDRNRPDWVGWFGPRHSDVTLNALSRLPSHAGTWTDLASARALVLDGWGDQ
ncbi:hypothetical protein AB0N59_04850 [Microbacterium sp. NPDC089321]|uniref:hypothetical protein n=1 Tax=Microbacterium sp. NPDC089321 TaxID=3155183 RepID=UPI00342F8864